MESLHCSPTLQWLFLHSTHHPDLPVLHLCQFLQYHGPFSLKSKPLFPNTKLYYSLPFKISLGNILFQEGFPNHMWEMQYPPWRGTVAWLIYTNALIPQVKWCHRVELYPWVWFASYNLVLTSAPTFLWFKPHTLPYCSGLYSLVLKHSSSALPPCCSHKSLYKSSKESINIHK